MHKWGIHEQKCQLFFHKKNVLYVFLFMYFFYIEYILLAI